MLLVTMIMLTVINVWYATTVSQRAQRAATRSATQQVQLFCALFTSIDTGFGAAPPTSVSGKLLASEVHQLVSQLGCPTS